MPRQLRRAGKKRVDLATLLQRQRKHPYERRRNVWRNPTNGQITRNMQPQAKSKQSPLRHTTPTTPAAGSCTGETHSAQKRSPRSAVILHRNPNFDADKRSCHMPYREKRCLRSTKYCTDEAQRQSNIAAIVHENGFDIEDSDGEESAPTPVIELESSDRIPANNTRYSTHSASTSAGSARPFSTTAQSADMETTTVMQEQPSSTRNAKLLPPKLTPNVPTITCNSEENIKARIDALSSMWSYLEGLLRRSSDRP